jgi:acyl phosphate:glycerol-3-phosphate acyltransferase
MILFIIVLFSYLCGSIPFGLILTKIFSGKDIRKIGSGNIGATNVLRTGSKFLALTTLILDLTKGFIPVVLVQKFYPEFFQVSAVMTFMGHVFPVWLKFKGGKGVATYLGILFATSLYLSFLFIFTWICVSLIFKYSSLSSIFATLTVFVVNGLKQTIKPILMDSSTTTSNTTYLLFFFLILIIFTHRTNIINLKNKKEEKIKI